MYEVRSLRLGFLWVNFLQREDTLADIPDSALQ
jgi:hypothetical protein